jgi:hypothetical protein
MVGALATVARIVANLGTILMSEDGDDRAIQIEDQTGTRMRLVDERLQQSIVKSMQLLPKALWRLEQETA